MSEEERNVSEVADKDEGGVTESVTEDTLLFVPPKRLIFSVVPKVQRDIH
jgi:hypothetical protein